MPADRASHESSPALRVAVGRGSRDESVHRVRAVVARDDGSLRIAHGDVASRIFPRSAVKSIQALVLLESGAADRYGLDDPALAVACSSHSGTAAHLDAVRSLLAKAGVDPSALECGAHRPLDEAAARALVLAGEEPSPLHNNCSGKHAGFLAAARHLGIDSAGYVLPDHPLQRIVTDTLAEVLGCELGADDRGIDGCSIPAFAVPPDRLATAFARIGTGVGLPSRRAQAFARLRSAAARHPELVAGGGRFDTRVMETCGARVFVKSGAEGVLCASIPPAGLGIAVKAEDGSARAAEAALAFLLRRLLPEPTPAECTLLDGLAAPVIRNCRGLPVGRISVHAGDGTP